MIPWHKKILMGAIVFFGLCVLASFAMRANAATLQWDRNTETDMKDYEVYSCTPNPTCTVQQSVTSRIGVVPQPAVGVVPSFAIPTGTEGKLAVSGSDLTGNEGPLSVAVPFDVKAPGAPVNPRLGP